MFDPENIEIAVGFLMLCAVCSTTRDMPGGKKYPHPTAGKRSKKTAAGTSVNKL